MHAGFACALPTRYHAAMMPSDTRFTLVLFAAVLALGLTGCAAPKKVWQKPGMNQDDWAVDSATCRSRAQHLAEREYTSQPEGNAAGVDNANEFNAMMRRHSAKRSIEDIYRRCLESKGYRLVEPQPATKA
jgi:uncharacterized lipoprotein YajG